MPANVWREPLCFGFGQPRYGNSGSIAQLYGKGEEPSALTGARWPIREECSLGVTPVLDEQMEPSVESLLRLVRGTARLTLINADGVSAPAELGYALFRIHGSTFPGCSPSPDGLICPEGSNADYDDTPLGEVRIYSRE